jgi:transcriptional regulator with XRE-family HTH domain
MDAATKISSATMIGMPTKAANPQFLKDFGKRLADSRKQRGLTQKELAEKVGIRQYVIASYETGRSQMSLGLLHSVAEALAVEPSELIGQAQHAKKRGPISQIEQLTSKLSDLPRNKQKVVVDMLEGFLKQTGT